MLLCLATTIATCDPYFVSTLADSIQDYWTRLAATGDVDGSPEPAWPIYDVSSDPYLQLEDPIANGASIRSKQCDFWDAVPSSG